MFRDALAAVSNMVAEDRGKMMLFVGTKRQAQDAGSRRSGTCRPVLCESTMARRLLTNFSDCAEIIKRLERSRSDAD
jgi:ribosomal protein S2